MRHFPANRFHPAIEGISHARVIRTVTLKTAVLLCATTFGAGFTLAVWTIGMIVTSR